MSWIGMLFIIAGFFLITYKVKWGFLVNAVGSAILVYSLWGIDWAVVALNVFFIAACLNGFYQWGWRR